MSTETSCPFGYLLLVSNHRLQQFLKNPLFYPFPIQKRKGPILTLPLNRSRSTQGHHLNKLGSTGAPDATYQLQGHCPFGSGEEDLLRFLPYMGVATIFIMWPGPFEQNFVPPSHGGSIWNLTLIGQAVSEEKMFKECGRRRTTEAYLYYKLTKWA